VCLRFSGSNIYKNTHMIIHMNNHVNNHVKTMSVQKIENKNVRKLSKTTRGSYLVRVPVDFIRALKWKDGQKVEFDFDKKRGRIVIKDWKK